MQKKNTDIQRLPIDKEDFISLKYMLIMAINKISKAEIRKLRDLNIVEEEVLVSYSIISLFLEIIPSSFLNSIA